MKDFEQASFPARMRAASLRHVVSTLALLCLAPGLSFGQQATLQGQVRDQSNAVVPGATITVIRTETGDTRVGISNGSGSYSIPLLQPGSYTVSIKKDGFRPVTRSDVKLDVQQVAQIDVSLELGAVSDVVQVRAEVSPLQLADSSQGQVIANKQITVLPLNGRNYTHLILLSNGATAPEPGTRGGTSGFSSNGQRSYQNNFLLDGADNNTNLLAMQSGDFEVIQPNLDAIEEFKVETSGYSAAYGRGSGAVVNVAIKSGTNQFHGTAFEFLRNDKIEANNFFNNRAGVAIPPFRQNQFGGTLGGPIRREKLFFFGDYQGTRIRRASTQYSNVPTDLERTGDFSRTLVGGRLQTIYDPQTYNAATGMRAAFPGNVIPANRLDGVARELVNLYPKPNATAAGTNFLSNFPIKDDANQYDLRGDVVATDSDRLFLRFSYQDRPIFNPPPLPPPAVGGTFNQGPRDMTSHSALIGYTHIFSSSLLSETRLAYTRVVADWATSNPQPLNQKYGIEGTAPELPGLAEMSLSGYATLGDPGYLPNLTKANNYEIAETIHWNRSRHDVSFGLNARQVQSTLYTLPQNRGSFSFTGNFTRQTSPLSGGNAIADFLLGIPTTATISTTSQCFYIRNPLALFVQDNWRVSKRLTVNLGLRYERAPWYHERYNSIANLFRTSGSSIPKLLTPDSPGVPGNNLVSTPNLNFAPRAGLVYQISNGLVMRAGYGVFYGAEEQMGGGVLLQTNPPFGAASAFATDNVSPNILLRSGFPPGASFGNVQRPNLNALSLNFPSPVSHQWNATLETKLPGNVVGTVAYVGSVGNHMFMTFPINAPPPGPGNINTRRPINVVEVPLLGIIPVGAIAMTEPRGLSNYHSLQVKAERRYSNGLFLLTSWIYSKAIDYGGEANGDGSSGNPNNPADLSQERGRSSYDLRHRVVVSYGYELPFGKGRAFARDVNRFADFLVGGWQMQGITTYQTGLPFTVSATGNASNTQSGDRPNVVGDPNTGIRSLDRWFDTAAFQRQAQYTFGNAGRDILSAPGIVNWSGSLFKNFVIREQTILQFRAEAFNLMNTANFARPGSQLGTASFGVISATATPPRQWQFALKLLF